jgi:uncharacterized membrane protein YuzA (DUF378 family)
MFCPNCGQAEQAPDSYCRSCGEFIADPSNRLSLLNRVFGVSSPEQQLNISLVINLVTAVVSVFLIFFLMGFFDGQHARTGAETPKIIYLVYIFLGLVAIWQFLSFMMGAQLKKKLAAARQSKSITELPAKETGSLPSADFENVVPPSVTEQPTQVFNERRRQS